MISPASTSTSATSSLITARTIRFFNRASVVALSGPFPSHRRGSRKELRWNRALTRVGEIETRIAAHDRATAPHSDLSTASDRDAVP
jgi:hypothetical protein